MPKMAPFQQKWQIRKEMPTSQKYAKEFMYKRVPLKGKILLLYKALPLLNYAAKIPYN